MIHLGHTHHFPFGLQGEVQDSAQLEVIRFYLDIASFSVCGGEQVHCCLCNKTPNTFYHLISTTYSLVFGYVLLHFEKCEFFSLCLSCQCCVLMQVLGWTLLLRGSKTSVKRNWILIWRMWVALLLESESALHHFQVNVVLWKSLKVNFSVAVACRVVTTSNWKTVCLVLLVVFFAIFLAGWKSSKSHSNKENLESMHNFKTGEVARLKTSNLNKC